MFNFHVLDRLQYLSPHHLTSTRADRLAHRLMLVPLPIKLIMRVPSCPAYTWYSGFARTGWNPFVFIGQVRKYYGKCYRSSEPLLVVLPCPWLCCICETAEPPRKFLILAGDLESNPGPELVVIVKQLQAIAAGITGSKEGRLGSIDKKLDSLAMLEVEI